MHLFRLMPENPSLPGQPAEPSSKEPKTFFTESVSLSPRSALHLQHSPVFHTTAVRRVLVSLCVCVVETEGLQCEVPHLACSVYYGALKDLPAMVRLWWNSQEKRVFSTVDKFTSKYVSGVLSAQEIASVQSSTLTFENMTVSAMESFWQILTFLYLSSFVICFACFVFLGKGTVNHAGGDRYVLCG